MTMWRQKSIREANVVIDRRQIADTHHTHFHCVHCLPNENYATIVHLGRLTNISIADTGYQILYIILLCLLQGN